MPETFKYGIVITGLIASGKSTVIKMLSARGYSVICADEIAHKILNIKAKQIAQIFGADLLETNFNQKLKNQPTINRAKLGKIVFSDNQARQKLQEILHPLIYEQIIKKAKKLEKEKKLYFVDIPLFFESGGKQKYNFKVALIYAPKSQALRRLIARNNLEKNQALLRINAQMDIEQKRLLSDFIINNSADLENLEKNLESFLEILNPFSDDCGTNLN